MTDYQPGQTATFEQVYSDDATSITFEVQASSGETLFGPTPYGISHAALGTYLASWTIPADQTPDTLTAIWQATVDAVPQTDRQPFTVVADGLVGAWCTLADVQLFTGVAVAQQHITIAQQLIEALTHRVWRLTDAATRDYYWLNRATAWQAQYVFAHPELMTMMDVQSISQDGIGLTFHQGEQFRVLYSPIALRILNGLFRASNTTVRFNSAFQKNRLTKIGVTAGSSVPWNNL